VEGGFQEEDGTMVKTKKRSEAARKAWETRRARGWKHPATKAREDAEVREGLRRFGRLLGAFLG
jgi:hypothetical protein